MKYVILRRTTIEDLIDIVNKCMELGWEPQGGVAVEYGGVPYFMQAVVKEEPDD